MSDTGGFNAPIESTNTSVGFATGPGASPAGAERGHTATTSRVVAEAARVGVGAPVKVGIAVDSNNGAFAAAFGFTNSQPDEKTVAQYIVADINKTGGLAGHPIDAVYKEVDSTSSDWIAQDQATCETFTRDNKVIVAVRTDDLFGPLDACMASAGVPLVLYESVFRSPSWFTTAPGLRFTPDSPTGARLYRALVDRLVATNRWTTATKVGLVRYDRADQEPIEREGIRAAMAAHGMALTASEAVHTPEGFQDIGTTTSQLAGVILRFRQLGIDHVVFQGGDLSYLFANAAQAQGYHPLYALTSFDFPNAMPTDQLHGAFGAGWEPADDILPPLPTTPGAARCDHAVAGTKADLTAAGADRVYLACDYLYFLKAAYDAAGSVGPGALAEGARRVGSAFPTAFTFSIDAAAHPDAVASFHDLLFDDGCGCLKYGPTSPLR